jgi:hypothetical protein
VILSSESRPGDMVIIYIRKRREDNPFEIDKDTVHIGVRAYPGVLATRNGVGFHPRLKAGHKSQGMRNLNVVK